MKPTVAQLSEVRNRTGLGVMEISKAFASSSAYEEVIETLKSRGTIISENRKDKSALVRKLYTYLHHNSRFAAIIEIATETDFAANSAILAEYAKDIVMQAAVMPFEDVDDLLKQDFFKDPTFNLADLIVVASGQLKEKVQLTFAVRREVDLPCKKCQFLDCSCPDGIIQ